MKPIYPITVLLLFCHCGSVIADPPSFRLGLTHWIDSENSRKAYHLGYQKVFASRSLRIDYHHEPILIRVGAPSHNGYLHRLDTGLAGSLGPIDLSLTAGVHGSSNMFKHLEFHGSALVFAFRGRYALADDQAITLRGDHRFGGFHVYPGYYKSIEFPGGAEIELELPVKLQFTRDNVQMKLERYGQKWATLDASRTVRAGLYADEWRVTVTRQFTSSQVNWRVGMGISVDTRFEYKDLTAGKVAARPGSKGYLTLNAAF